MNLKFPIGTEMLNEGLQTKGLFKMEHFSAGGCFKWVWLVTHMKQYTGEKPPCRNGDKNKKYLFGIKLLTLLRKVKECQEGRVLSM